MLQLPFSLRNYLYAFVGLIVYLFSGCSKDANDVEPKRASEVRVTLNGQAWSSGINNTALSGNLRQIFAVKPDSTSIRLYFPADTTGTFDLATNSDVTVAYYEGSTFWSTEVSGSLIITRNNTSEIEGSFEGELVSVFNSDTINLQNGTFYWGP